MPETSHQARPDLQRRLRWAAALALAYFVGSELGYAISLGPSVGGTFWPPAGITLAFLLASPAGWWPLLISAGALANYLSDQLHDQTLPASVGFALANLSEPVLAAFLLRRTSGAPVTFSRLSEVALLALVAVCVTAPVAAAIGALTAEWFTLNPPGFAAGWRTWWIGDAVGTLVVTPFVLRLLTGWRQLSHARGRAWLEAAVFALAVLVVTDVVFSAPPTMAAMPFLVFPVLLWGSVRLGVVAVGAALGLIVLLTAHDTAAGLGPFAAESLSLGDRLIALQVYVGVMALSFYGMAALWEERTRATAALRLAHSGLEARHRRIVEQSPLAIATVKPDGTVFDANPAWRRLWPQPESTEGGARPPGRDPQVAPLLARAFTGDVVELHERELSPVEGQTTRARRVRGFAYPVKDDKGGVAEVVVIERDITDEVAARQQLVDANQALRDREEALSHALREMAEAQTHREQLLAAERFARGEAERALQLKDEFLATLSHELRTPLNAIVGWAHVLRQHASDPATTPAVEAITRNAQAQAKLIEDLLDMSRIMAGKIGLTLARTRLSDVASAAIAALQPAADARGVTLSASPAEAHDTWVLADAPRLQQVVVNMLDNGIKFTPAGGTVELRIERQPGEALIVVRDTGEGIHPDFVPAVFDRFRQADGSTKRRHGGLGIGLSIARQIVDMHGGSIRAHSDGIGQGAVFTVALPLADKGHTDAAGPVRPAEPLPPLDGLRVVVVDDNADARELLRRLLAERQCRVVCVASVEEAARTLEQQGCDVLLTDIGMPGENGYDLLRRVRNSTHAATKIVAVTAFARREDRDRALAHGFDGHVSKPVDAVELMSLLGQLRREALSDGPHSQDAMA